MQPSLFPLEHSHGKVLCIRWEACKLAARPLWILAVAGLAGGVCAKEQQPHPCPWWANRQQLKHLKLGSAVKIEFAATHLKANIRGRALKIKHAEGKSTGAVPWE
jgi:hypothetical protein